MSLALRERTVAVLGEHALRYPSWCVADAYKLIYQACMGPKHAATDAEAVRRRLAAEWETVTADSGRPLIEDIGIHAPLWRLNLAPAKASGVAFEEISERFLGCMCRFSPRPNLLVPLWEIARGRIANGSLPVTDHDALARIDRSIREGGFPSVHHSARFRSTYAPAYCLVCDVDGIAGFVPSPGSRRIPP